MGGGYEKMEDTTKIRKKSIGVMDHVLTLVKTHNFEGWKDDRQTATFFQTLAKEHGRVDFIIVCK
jgi:hypothetical protein